MRTQRKSCAFMYIYNGIASRMAPCMLPTRSCSQLQFWWNGKFTKTRPHLIYIIFQHLPFSCARYYMILPFMLCCDILHGNPPWWKKTCWKGILLLLGLSRESMFPAISTDLQLFEAFFYLASVHDFAGYARLFFDGQLSPWYRYNWLLWRR